MISAGMLRAAASAVACVWCACFFWCAPAFAVDIDAAGIGNGPDVSVGVADGDGAISLPNPVYVITSLSVHGNVQTSASRIAAIMGLSVGDGVTLDELEDMRVRLALSGIFEYVGIGLAPGNGAGELGVTVTVVERSGIQLNRYWLGFDGPSGPWAGVDVTVLAPVSLPCRFRMAFGAAADGSYMFDTGLSVTGIAGTPLYAFAGVSASNSNEEVYDAASLGYLGLVGHRRQSVAAGVGYALGGNLRIMGRASLGHLERVGGDADEATGGLGAKGGVGLDGLMEPGSSWLFALTMGASFDTRPGRVIPDDGHLVSVTMAGAFGGDYTFIRLGLRHQSNFPIVPGHIIRVQTFAGMVYGDAPFEEKFFAGDFAGMIPGRMGGVNVAGTGAWDLLGLGSSSLSYEDMVAHVGVTYAWQPLRRRLELFATVSAVWADSFDRPGIIIGVEPRGTRGSFPADVAFDAGLRYVSSYGTFEVSLGCLYGLIPR